MGPKFDQLVIGHADATVPNSDSDGGVDLVRDDLDVEIELNRMLSDDAELIDHEVTGVETDTALDVVARSHGLHEGIGEGVDLARDDLDVEIELTLNLTWVSERPVPVPVQSHAGIDPPMKDSIMDVELVGSGVQE